MQRLRQIRSQIAEHLFHDVALCIDINTGDVPYWELGIDAQLLQRIPFVLMHAVLASVPSVRWVITPLMGPGFDAMDVAAQLDKAGFTGKLAVVTPALPRPAMIRVELQQQFPGLHLQLVTRSSH